MWTTGPGGERPDAEQLALWRRRLSAPTNEVPVASPVPPLLVRNDVAAVAVTAARTYSVGVRLDLAVRARARPGRRIPTDLHRVVHGHGPADAGGPDARLLIGVEFADGRTGDNLGGRLPTTDDDPDRPVLSMNASSSGGGSSDGFVMDGGLWLTPLPPDGALALVVAWPVFDLAETRVEWPDATFTSDAARVEVLWPEGDPGARTRPEPPPPDVPPGSWFSRR